jgi:nucleoside phosphorylase
VYTGHHDGRPIVLAITGMGREQATHVVESLMRRCGPQRVLVSGTAGATRADLNTGDVILPARVIDAEGNSAWEPTWPAPTEGVLRTGGAVIESAADKAALHDQRGIDAVDMETAAIVRVCEHYQTPWLCARAICDTAEMTLPPGSAKLVDRRGRPRVIGAACYVMLHPSRVGELMRLGRAARCAAEALARHVPPLLER